ncbi:MAG: hypothetical protein KGZ58_01935 [Ignavibacteriales bacterium]|nr:hypothetical protein [Ignavibacteriales bacterium]
MKQNYVFFITALLLSTFSSGCMMFMHGGMMGDSHDSQSQNKHDMKPTVKEVTVGDYRIVAEFPHLMQHEETNFTLKIFSSKDSLWTNAKVRIQVANENKEKLVDEILSSSEKQMYDYQFIPHEKGKFTISFVVEQLDESLLKMPITLSETLETMEMGESHQNHSSGFELTPTMVVGGVVMLAMMVVMMGRIF